jgi:hypothetical protein
MAIFKKIAITLGHRSTMRSYLQQTNSLDSLFRSKGNKFFWKCDLNVLNMFFRLSIWPNGHRESQKYEYERGTGRTNEAVGLIIFSPKSPKKSCLDFTRIAYSVPEVHELVAQSWHPRRWSCYFRVHPVPPPSGLSMSRSKLRAEVFLTC